MLKNSSELCLQLCLLFVKGQVWFGHDSVDSINHDFGY